MGMFSKAGSLLGDMRSGASSLMAGLGGGGQAALSGAAIGAAGGAGLHLATGIAGSIMGSGDFPSVGSTMSKALLGGAIGAGIGFGAFKNKMAARRAGMMLGGLTGGRGAGIISSIAGKTPGFGMQQFQKGFSTGSAALTGGKTAGTVGGRYSVMKAGLTSNADLGGRLGAGLMAGAAAIGMYKSSNLRGSVSSNYGYR